MVHLVLSVRHDRISFGHLLKTKQGLLICTASHDSVCSNRKYIFTCFLYGLCYLIFLYLAGFFNACFQSAPKNTVTYPFILGEVFKAVMKVSCRIHVVEGEGNVSLAMDRLEPALRDDYFLCLGENYSTVALIMFVSDKKRHDVAGIALGNFYQGAFVLGVLEVSKKLRRTKKGTILLDALKKMCIKRGIDRIEAWCFKMQEILNFWKMNGFQLQRQALETDILDDKSASIDIPDDFSDSCTHLVYHLPTVIAPKKESVRLT